ncbi:hypothetical protein DDZ18_03115 [Marinicauda salina]|uniref:DUF3775 domain-containing protein n=1 Tax=Marinicauda salina TaxID=2135793 RepID=A0A2U2BXB0_9PROT|nr:DUF3775 domain-containing protein [Marinicauda salina]PWE18609.1 hypothetical protein DDZ18_03115 [Marinicauda salina]
MAVELTITPKRAFYILVKAREFDEKVEQSDPDSGSNPADDRSVQILESAKDDPTFDELTQAIDACNVDEKADLLALIWVGRGDYAADEWDEARRQAEDALDEHLAAYVAGTPLSSDYLEEGLSALGYSLEKFEINRL